MSPNVLVVCTANQCRSPVGAALLSDLSTRFGDGGWEVASAGTHATPGALAAPYSRRLTKRWGHDLSRHRAHRLDRDAVARADLVITLERDHLAAVVHLAPSAMSRSFTWLELAGLAPRADVQQPSPGDAMTRLRHSLRALHRARPMVSISEYDVEDPIGQPWEAYQQMATTLATSAERFLPLLLLGSKPEDPAVTDDTGG